MSVVGSSTINSPQQGSYVPKVETVSAPAPEMKVTEAPAPAISKPETSSQGEEKEKKQKEASPEAIKKAVADLNKHANGTEAIFGIHEKTNRLTIKIVDKETKELIKELPAEKTLDLIAKAWEMAGLMVDEKR